MLHSNQHNYNIILKVNCSIPTSELHRRSSIRTWTIRYVLALLKYLHPGGKIDLLNTRSNTLGLFQYFKDDPPDLVQELLSTTETHIFKDEELPGSAKSAIFDQKNLEKVVEVATRSPGGHPVAEKAFEWLMTLCTNSGYALLRQSGFYPPGTAREQQDRGDDSMIDLRLNSLDFYDRDSRPQVRNPALLSFVQNLRPHSNLKERELILACFIAAPELVAAYFSEKSLQLDPKLSNTWIGYASFLFEVVKLPLPQYLGYEKEWAQVSHLLDKFCD